MRREECQECLEENAEVLEMFKDGLFSQFDALSVLNGILERLNDLIASNENDSEELAKMIASARKRCQLSMTYISSSMSNVIREPSSMKHQQQQKNNRFSAMKKSVSKVAKGSYKAVKEKSKEIIVNLEDTIEAKKQHKEEKERMERDYTGEEESDVVKKKKEKRIKMPAFGRKESVGEDLADAADEKKEKRLKNPFKKEEQTVIVNFCHLVIIFTFFFFQGCWIEF